MEKTKKKMHFIAIFRLLIQIVSFVLLPALYINAFAGIHAIYTGIISNSFDIVALWPQIVEVVAILPITILFGRFFCGWMCAFGTLGDMIYLFSSKVLKIKFKMNETTDRVLKSIKYILLAFLVIVVWTLGIDTFTTSNPWDAFGFIFTFGKVPAIGYAISTLLPGTILLGLIMAGSLFVERFFCRYLCPLGAVFAIASRLRIAKIRKPTEKCGKCTICTKSCAMGIPLYKSDVVCSGECINCFKCVTACPRSNVSIAVAEKDLRPVVAGILMASVISGTYYAGSLAANSTALTNSATVSASQDVNGSTASATAASSTTTTASNTLYNDGTYQGNGTGFRGGQTIVSVTVKNDAITDVTVVSNEDDAPFFNRASGTVISEILSSQSANVNAVSGATYSSNGIMTAVADALSSAAI